MLASVAADQVSAMLSLIGKRILITGTGRGQGEVVQRVFAELGAKIAGCDIIAGSAEASAERLRASGHTAWGKTADLGDPAEAEAWVTWAVNTIGGIDVLFNNAGAPRMASFGELTVDDWKFTMRNELDLVFYTTRAAWPHLLRSCGASVITTASISGKIGWGSMGQVAHSAAKGGLLSFTRQLAAEGGPLGVRANSISPGFIRTPITEDVVDAAMEDGIRATMQLSPRPVVSTDIAYAAAYLASDLSLGITGEDIAVDGGWSAGRPGLHG